MNDYEKLKNILIDFNLQFIEGNYGDSLTLELVAGNENPNYVDGEKFLLSKGILPIGSFDFVTSFEFDTNGKFKWVSIAE